MGDERCDMKSLVNRNLLPCRFGEDEKQLEAESQKRYEYFLDKLNVKYCYTFPHRNIVRFLQNPNYRILGVPNDETFTYKLGNIYDHARAFCSEEFQERFLVYQPYHRQVNDEPILARECQKRGMDFIVSNALSWHMPGSTCLYIIGTKEFIEYAKGKLL